MKKWIFILGIMMFLLSFLWEIKKSYQAISESFPLSDETTEVKGKERSVARIQTTRSLQKDVNSPLEIAKDYLNKKKEDWKIRPYHEFQTEQIGLPIGTKVIFTAYQEGVELLNEKIVLVVSKRGKIISEDVNYSSLEKGEPDKSDVSELIKKISKKYAFEEEIEKEPTPVFFTIPGLTKPETVYPVTVQASAGIPMVYLFRARDGEVVSRSRARKEF